MAKLGLIKDLGQLPDGFHKVTLAASPASPSAPLSSSVSSLCLRGGCQRFTLTFEVPPGPEHVHRWAGPMAEALDAMGWDQWWLDTDAVATILDNRVIAALGMWGNAFWLHYQHDAVVLFDVGPLRGPVRDQLSRWEEWREGLAYDPEHDYDALAQEREAKRASFMRTLTKPLSPSTWRQAE